MAISENLWETRLFSQQESAHLTLYPVIAYRGQVHRAGLDVEIAHPFFTWWWIEEGCVEVTTKNESYKVEAGSWILIPNGLWRRQRFEPSAKIISINFAALWRENLPLIRATAPLIGSHETVPGLPEKAARVTEALDQQEEPSGLPPLPPLSLHALPLARRFQLLGALYDFSSALFSHAVAEGAAITHLPSRDPRVDWVVLDLQLHLRAGPLPLARWQERTGLSRSQLERLAKKHLGQSLHTYRDELLATATCRALTADRPLVKQVAEQFGFVDTAHFCRWLRARTGHTPATLQRTAVV